MFRPSPNALAIILSRKKWPYPPKWLILVKKLNKEGHFRCRKWVLGFAMKIETNVINELWGVWAPCFCTFYSLGCVAPLAFGSGNQSWIDHFKGRGAAPSFSEKSNLIGDQFSFIFIFKLKLENPKIYCLGFLGASFSVIFFPRPYFDTRLRLGNHS